MFTFQKGYIRSCNEEIDWKYNSKTKTCSLVRRENSEQLFVLNPIDKERIMFLHETQKTPMFQNFKFCLTENNHNSEISGVNLHSAKKGQNCLLICSLLPGEKARCPRKSNVFFSIDPKTGDVKLERDMPEQFGPFDYPLEIGFNLCQGGKAEIGSDFRKPAHVAFRFTNKRLLGEVN